MLPRASKQRLSKQWQQRLESLHLPWLCPTLYGVALIRGSPKTSAISYDRPTLRSRSTLSSLSRRNVTNSRPTQRGLASAATAEHEISYDQFIPFEASAASDHKTSSLDRPWNLLQDPDRITPIVVKELFATSPQRFRSVNAISGEVGEIKRTIRACIQVGRLGRAATLMRRLNEIYKPKAPELLAAHNSYLRELVLKVVKTKDQQVLKDIHKWFEVDLRGVLVVPDATTYALMIQAALQESNVKKINRTVRRYMSLADKAGVRDLVMQIMLVISNEQDIGRVTQIAPPVFENISDLPTEIPTLPTPTVAECSSAEAAEVFEIRETKQKGLGLISLKKALSVLSKEKETLRDPQKSTPHVEMHNLGPYERQKQLEASTYDAAIERWRKDSQKMQEMGMSLAFQMPTVGGLMWNWHEKLVSLINEEIRKSNEAEDIKVRSNLDRERCLYGPFLQLLPAEKLSAITILTCMSSLSNDRGHKGLPLSLLVTQVGRAVADEYLAEKCTDLGDEKILKTLRHQARASRLNRLVHKHNARVSPSKDKEDPKIVVPNLGADQYEVSRWSIFTKIRVGAVLTSCLIDAAKIEVLCNNPNTGQHVHQPQAAFFHSFTLTRGKRVGIVRFNKALVSKLMHEPVNSVMAKYLPMIVEPRPWRDYRTGAFLSHQSRAIRVSRGDLHSRLYAIAASESGDMAQMFSGLDVLSRTPWRINRAVFEAMVACWNSGEPMGKIVSENPPVKHHPEPAPDADSLTRRRWFADVQNSQNMRAGLKSQRCFQNFQLEIARAYLDEIFFFPHNVDFRGRAYPMVPFFNHMGADPCRSLLIFARGKELGETGLRWLKIHLASLYGHNKSSFDDREKFTQDHLLEISDSAKNPIAGSRWWLSADDPWQCLSACIELTNALEQSDPRKFVSHLPIHQDGTCNGLQHYAALGGDPLGAKQVNLVPGERPSDIYTAVADMVAAAVADDATQENAIAKWLENRITRKIVKQTVMTKVYGVTFLGARRQVQQQLEDASMQQGDDVDLMTLLRASTYVASKILASLSTMFSGAQEIQYWLGDCAERITKAVTPEQIERIQSKANLAKLTAKDSSPFARTLLGHKAKNVVNVQDLFRSVVIWTTPLKMTVVQPYRSANCQVVETNLQRLNIIAPKMSDLTHRRKQLQGFPPNFIHSLDATHMMLTALGADKAGLSFAAVHDSFWTHAGDVDTMNTIIRETFVRMHSEDIIGRLRSEFVARYKGCLHQVYLTSGSEVVKKINRWRRENKMPYRRAAVDELVLEYRRLKLLASDNPEERLEGQSMITPGRLFEEMAKDKDLILSAELEETLIGHVPSDIPAEYDDDDAVELPESMLSNALADDQVMEDPFENDPNRFGVNHEAEQEDVEPATTKKLRRRNCAVWVPISFPPAPKKGNFDVSTVTKSQYFFS